MPKHGELIPPGCSNQGRYGQHMFEKYKINCQDFEQFWGVQNGQCAGCKKQLAHPWRKEGPFGVQAQIDHIHRYDESGNELPCRYEDVRGLLCARCNSLLGKLRDNKDILKGLLFYLQRSGQ